MRVACIKATRTLPASQAQPAVAGNQFQEKGGAAGALSTGGGAAGASGGGSEASGSGPKSGGMSIMTV